MKYVYLVKGVDVADNKDYLNCVVSSLEKARAKVDYLNHLFQGEDETFTMYYYYMKMPVE